jgi:hypothetical protein
MTPEMLWSAVLSGTLAFFAWVLRTHAEEVKRLQILLNRTREDYATKADLHSDINRILSRLDLMEKKIDRLIEKGIK